MTISQYMDETTRHRSPGTRKQQIIAAANTVLLEVGIERFTVDQVVAKAGIAKGTVYKYYRNKDEVLSELTVLALRLLHEKFVQSTEGLPSSIDKIKAVCMANYRYHQEFPEYAKLLAYAERPEFDIRMEEYFKISYSLQDFVQSIIVSGQKNDEIKKTFNPVIVGNILWACSVGVVQFVDTKEKLLKDIHAIKQEEMINCYMEMITEGIRS